MCDRHDEEASLSSPRITETNPPLRSDGSTRHASNDASKGADQAKTIFGLNVFSHATESFAVCGMRAILSRVESILFVEQNRRGSY